jgi:hypothetical protein
VTHDRGDQGRFADAVAAQDGHAFARSDPQVKRFEPAASFAARWPKLGETTRAVNV